MLKFTKILPITKNNATLQVISALRESRYKRFEEKKFIIEGRMAINAAIENKCEIDSVFFSNRYKLSNWAKESIKKINPQKIYEVLPELMDNITDKSEPGELIAVAKSYHKDFESYKPNANELVIVLDQPKSPGNMGTIFRSAAAFGIKTIVISGHAADEYDPKCIRGSTGAFFSINVYKTLGIKTFSNKLEELKQSTSVNVIASGHKAPTPLNKLVLKKPGLSFLIFGNETFGISKGYEQIADDFVRIPLDGKYTSLNIGVAASIFLYKIFCENHESTINNNDVHEYVNRESHKLIGISEDLLE